MDFKSLPDNYYRQLDVVALAQDLLGREIQTSFGNVLTSGIIVETEAYRGEDDKASHAYAMKKTPRTSVMFQPGGLAYIYLCYGIHHMLNVVVGPEDVPNAILIRAIEPIHGVKHMLERRKKAKLDRSLTSGPGKVGQALGCNTVHTGMPLFGPDTSIQISNQRHQNRNISSGPRIGIDYAEECISWPWRFWVTDNVWVSK